MDDDALDALKALAANPSMRFPELQRTALSISGLEELRDVVVKSSLAGLNCYRIIQQGEPAASCSLKVHQVLEDNYQKTFGAEGQIGEGVSFDSFSSLNGLSRLVSNTPDVRLIGSVYRIRHKRKRDIQPISSSIGRLRTGCRCD